MTHNILDYYDTIYTGYYDTKLKYTGYYKKKHGSFISFLLISSTLN